MDQGKLEEFFRMWDEFWDSDLGGGPSFNDLSAKVRELKVDIGYKPPKKQSKGSELHFEPESKPKRKTKR